jgi:hypothetical protein
MFVIVYRYKIPLEKTNDFINLEKRAIKIYLEYGCTDVQIYRNSNISNRWMEVNFFKDYETYQQVIEKVNQDSRMDLLFKAFMELLYVGEPEPEKETFYRIL